MIAGSTIAETTLWEDYFENMHDAYDSMRQTIKMRGVSQDELATRLDADKGLISKRVNGSKNLTLKTLSFMATALQCRLAITFVPYDEVGAVEQRSTSEDADLKQSASKRTNSTDEPAEAEALRMAMAA